MKQVLITGAGMVGSQIAKILSEGYNVKPVLLDINFQHRYLETIINRDLYCEEVCSVLDETRVFEIIKKHKIDTIIHTAAILPMRVGHDPHPGFFQVNTWGSSNLIFSAIKAGVSKFVLFSTNGVYQFRKYGVSEDISEDYPSGLNETNSYANSKATVEYLLKELTAAGKIDGKIVRPGEIYGPVMNKENDDPIYWKGMIDAAITGNKFILENHPEHKLDWVYSKDVAKVASLVAMKDSSALEFHAASGKIIGIYQLKQALDNLFPDNKIELKNCSKGGWNYPLSMNRVKKEFNFEPEFTLELGIKDYLKWYMDNFHHE